AKARCCHPLRAFRNLGSWGRMLSPLTRRSCPRHSITGRWLRCSLWMGCSALVAWILREDLRVNLHRPYREQTATLLTQHRGRVGFAAMQFAHPVRLVREAAGWARDRDGQQDLARRLPPIRFVRSVGGRRGGAVLIIVLTRHCLVGRTIRLEHGSCPF